MTKKRFLFTAGERLRGLRELMGLSRPAFAEIVGIKPKRLENIENGWQKMHDEDFEKVCSVFEEFSRWIAYEGPLDRQPLELKVADSAQRAAVYLVKRNPELLESSGLSLEEWTRRHQAVLDELSDSEEHTG
ncbi:helix-turn-helix transcriptional regulator [Pseudomonas sp. CrR25]|nr:helix-turn-helix transcriptional regulator [Pseudomonas sp. CrR25]